MTRPALFADYLVDQLELLIEDYDVEVEAVPGRQEIPFPYVLESGHDLALADVRATDLARWFPATELADIGDEIADGVLSSMPDAVRPALRPSMSSASSSSPTITAISMSSSAGRAASSARAAPISRSRARTG